MKKTLRILLFALVGITISTFVYISIRQAQAWREIEQNGRRPYR